jgi:HPt (histidine-containing phosphotransfer) domain-containing protein
MATLDASILEELRELAGVQALHETIALFEAGARRHLLALRQQQQDASAFARTAHSLRGSCAIIGVRRMAELSGRLEELARAQVGGAASADLLAVLEQLEAEFPLALEALEDQRRRLAR